MKHYALITGATSGLGLAYAKWFAGKGYDLIMTGRRKEVIERDLWNGSSWLGVVK